MWRCAWTPPPARASKRLFVGERLGYPAGYPNATAAQWLMAFWPALLLARGRRVPWALRGLLAGGAVVLADVALLSQSRGSLYATPVMIVLVFALVPAAAAHVRHGCACRAWHRRNSAARCCASAIASDAVRAPTLPRTRPCWRCSPPRCSSAARGRRRRRSRAAARLAGGGQGAASRRRRRRPGNAPRGRSWAVWLVAGNPLTRVRHGWESFKGGYSTEATAGNRLLSGLGSNRYDFYRVALDEFKSHPLVRDRRRQLPAAVPSPRSQRRDASLSPQRRAAHARRRRECSALCWRSWA